MKGPLVRAAVAVGCLAALAAWYGVGTDAATGPAVIRVTNELARLDKVDLGRRGRSAGDVEVSLHRIYNRRITPRPIGRVELVCTYAVGLSRSCHGTVFLPRGKIVIGGNMRYRSLYQLAILGGTGLYDNARGTLTVTRRGNKPARDLMRFRLTG